MYNARWSNRAVAGACLSVMVVSLAWGDTRVARDAKGSAVSFRLASRTPTQGYEKLTFGADQVLYVSPQSLWTATDVAAAQTQASRDGAAVELTLTDEATRRLATILGKPSGAEVAIFVDGKLTAAGSLAADVGAGRVTVGGLSSGHAERVTKLVNGEVAVPAGPVFTVVPAGRSGERYLVDVFVEGIVGLRSYQVALEAAGGQRGRLTTEDVKIDTARSDYVFGESEAVTAADQVGKRIGAVLYHGSAEAAKPAYLGTYTLAASPDARGTFRVNVQVGPETILADTRNKTMPFSVGAEATITVGVASNPRLGGN